MNKKLVFLDIDGTIRNYDGAIPDSSVRAIRQARRNGHEVLLCSGRPVRMLEKRITDIGFDGVVACTGGTVIYKGETISSLYFDRLEYLELMDYLIKRDCIVDIETDSRGYMLRENLEAYARIQNVTVVALGIEDGRTTPHLIDHASELADVMKLVAFGPIAIEDQLLKDWPDLNITGISFPFSADDDELWAWEITPAGMNKVSGIRCVMEAGGYDREDVIAVGDGENDIDMIGYAGQGVAMGNAVKEAREAADLVTADIMSHGLEKAFIDTGLLES